MSKKTIFFLHFDAPHSFALHDSASQSLVIAFVREPPYEVLSMKTDALAALFAGRSSFASFLPLASPPLHFFRSNGSVYQLKVVSSLTDCQLLVPHLQAGSSLLGYTTSYLSVVDLRS